MHTDDLAPLDRRSGFWFCLILMMPLQKDKTVQLFELLSRIVQLNTPHRVHKQPKMASRSALVFPIKAYFRSPSFELSSRFASLSAFVVNLWVIPSPSLPHCPVAACIYCCSTLRLICLIRLILLIYLRSLEFVSFNIVHISIVEFTYERHLSNPCCWTVGRERQL